MVLEVSALESILRRVKTLSVRKTSSAEIINIVMNTLLLELEAKEILADPKASDERKKEAENILKIIDNIKKELVRQYYASMYLGKPWTGSPRIYELFKTLMR